MKLAIFGNNHQHQYIGRIADFFSFLRQQDIEFAVQHSFASYIKSQMPDILPFNFFDDHSVPQADAALSIGGDGTMLHTAYWIAGSAIPVMGLNTGHLGYLTAAGIDEAEEMVMRLLNADYKIEERTLLQVDTSFDKTIDRPFALNEVAILRQDTSSMISMQTAINGTHLTTYKGDGLVICTPTGSTAYNMSVGGPILEPTASCMVLSPISPHSLNMRPLVIRNDSTITVSTQSRASNYQVSIDGRLIQCPNGSTVTVRKAPFSVRILQKSTHDFAHTLRLKLMWGTDRR